MLHDADATPLSYHDGPGRRRRYLAAAARAGGRAGAGDHHCHGSARAPVICFAPQYVCEALLRAEGFTDVRYVDTTPQTQEEDLGRGKFEFQSNLPLDHAIAIDRGLPITVLTGVHAGCYELFAHGGIRGIADLKGKRVGGDSRLLSLIAAYVGLDPKKDLTLVDVFGAKGVDLFTEGKLDAYMAFPPEAAGVARAQGRPCDPPDRSGPALVAVFLLHDGGEPGVCAHDTRSRPSA